MSGIGQASELTDLWEETDDSNACVSGVLHQTGFQLLFGRETAGRLLGVPQLPVDRDLEDATTGFDQFHGGIRPLLEEGVPRRTGARFIPSSPAVFDLDFHG